MEQQSVVEPHLKVAESHLKFEELDTMIVPSWGSAQDFVIGFAAGMTTVGAVAAIVAT